MKDLLVFTPVEVPQKHLSNPYITYDFDDYPRVVLEMSLAGYPRFVIVEDKENPTTPDQVHEIRLWAKDEFKRIKQGRMTLFTT